MNQKSFIPHIVSLLIIILSSCLYFFPQFQGKKVNQGDIISVIGMGRETVSYTEKTGERPLWTNSMFGGMPNYQIVGISEGNMTKYVANLLKGFIPQPAGSFILGMVSFYLLMLLLGVSHCMALIGALFFGFSTNNMVLWEAGHTSKVNAIMSSPLIIAGMILIFRKKYLLGASIYLIGLCVNLHANHVQMTYFLGLLLAVLVLVEIIKYAREKDFRHLLVSGSILLLGPIIALGTSASNMLPTFEYSKSTMRGGQILENTDAKASKPSNGLDFEYAMQWSNGVGDLFSSFIPGAVGGGSAEPVGKSSNFAKQTGQIDMRLPLYFGSLPFTSGPIYFGIVAFFLFVLGAFGYKSSLKWWALGGVALTMLLSLGKNDPLFTPIFFDYLPYYNKFRTPNSILSVTVVLIPFLGILALNDLIKEDKERYLKPLYLASGTMIAICLGFWLMGTSFFDFTSDSDQQLGQYVDAVKEDRIDYMKSSAFRSLIFVVLVSAALYFYLKSKLSPTILLGVVGVLGFFDLFQIDKRYLSTENFVSKRAYEKNFEPRLVDKQILQDTDPSFRVLDLSINTFNKASSSYFHKTVGGYSPAKLRRFQDVIDRHITKNNMNVLNMLNTKYFITPGEGENVVSQMNPAAMGNAWFVNDVKFVENANAEIDSLTNFTPSAKAIVHKEFKDKIKNVKPIKDGVIQLKSYHPDRMEYEYDTKSDQFAVFSEVWYTPGWQAYIDGKPVDHVRVNYILRGMDVPAGKHKITFEFKPKSFEIGKMISLITSILSILFLIFAIFRSKGEFLSN